MNQTQLKLALILAGFILFVGLSFLLSFFYDWGETSRVTLFPVTLVLSAIIPFGVHAWFIRRKKHKMRRVRDSATGRRPTPPE